MVDFKQYIVTLIAVFLSLALGIFIGNAVLGDDLVIAQQQEIIQHLDRKYNKLQEEHRRLQEQLSVLEAWHHVDYALERALLPLLKGDDSLDVQIAVVNTSGRELDPNLLDFLEEWGGDLQIITSFSPRFSPEEPELLAVLVEEYGYGKSGRISWGDFVSYLAGAVTGTKGGDLLEILINKSWLLFTGNPLADVDVVLLVGGAVPERCSAVEDLEQILIPAWLEEGLRVIAVENIGSTTSYIRAYRQWGISTVDHIDTLAGRVSLVYLLGNEREGHFGVRTEGQEPLPLEWFQGLVKGQ